MSQKRPLGLTVAEKFFGLIIILIGVFTVNITYSNIRSIKSFIGIFIIIGIVLMALGFFLVLTKAE